jgi:hypothetical protein
LVRIYNRRNRAEAAARTTAARRAAAATVGAAAAAIRAAVATRAAPTFSAAPRAAPAIRAPPAIRAAPAIEQHQQLEQQQQEQQQQQQQQEQQEKADGFPSFEASAPWRAHGDQTKRLDADAHVHYYTSREGPSTHHCSRYATRQSARRDDRERSGLISREIKTR